LEASADEPFRQALAAQGKEPVAFIRAALDRQDLIVFDEGLHHAQEPWSFYLRLLQDPSIRKRVRRVFLEVLSTADQRHLDAFLANPKLDPTLLVPALQDDFSGYGWRYQNLQDFLEGVWRINHQLPEQERIRVVGVSMPIFWKGIQTRADYEVFQDSTRSQDHHMQAVIADHMDDFRSGLKGFFLTNTRHAYTGLRRADGGLFWNCTTFLAQQFPGRVYSVRIHNAALKVEAKAKPAGPHSTDGLAEMSYRWVRMEGGSWDRAFASAGNQAVALPLAGNAFGRSAYIGNQMLAAKPGSTMAEVHDGLVFLAPLERLHLCGRSDLICTPTFREELKRRIDLLEGPDLRAFMAREGAKHLDAFLDVWAKPTEARPNRMLAPPVP
jgi:hypothetical protein